MSKVENRNHAKQGRKEKFGDFGLKEAQALWIPLIRYPEYPIQASDYGQPALLTPLPVVREWTKKIRSTPSSLQRGHHYGLTACDHDGVLVMG